MGRRKNKQGFNSNNQELGYPVILVVILAYIYTRNYIISRIGISGSAYLFTSLDLVAIFIGLIPYGLTHVISSFIKSRIKANQLPNAKRFMYGGFVIAFIYSAIVILLMFIFRNIIANTILLKNASSIILCILALTIFFISFNAVYKAYFIATKNQGTLLIIELFEKILLVAGVIISCNILMGYGKKAAMVLLNEEAMYAFGAIGCSIGIAVSSLISLIISAFIFSFYKRTLQDSSYVGKYDDIYDILSIINSDLFKNALPTMFGVLSLFSLQTIYLLFLKTETLSVMSYNMGIYSGVFITFILAPLFWIAIYSLNERREISIAVKSADTSELRIKMADMIKYALIIGIGFSVFVEIEATNIIEGLILVSSDKASFVVRLGIPAVILICLAITFTIFLQSVKKNMAAISNSMIALGCTILSGVIFVSVLKLGIYGVLISLYIFGIILTLLNAKSLRKYIKRKNDIIRNNILIIISFVVTGIITFILSLVFKLFMLPVLIVISCLLIYVLISFVLLTKLSVLNSYLVMKYPLNGLFYWLGKTLHLI